METKSAGAECSPTLSPAARGRALIDAWRHSGMSLSAFARHHQVRKQRIYYWSKRLQPLKVADKAAPAPVAPPDFVQIAVQVPRSVPPPHRGAATLEVLLPGGAVIRIAPGVDLSLLRLVVQTLVLGGHAMLSFSDNRRIFLARQQQRPIQTGALRHATSARESGQTGPWASQLFQYLGHRVGLSGGQSMARPPG